jgi:phosphoribosylformylglycinamidine synthase
MGGNLGMELDLRSVPVKEKLSNTRILYSESAGRLVITIDPKKEGAFEDLMGGLDCACIGRVTDADILQVTGMDGNIIIKETIGDLKDTWKEPFGDLV